MKIVCDNCSAKYSIADDKVAGKVFKIRCKRCESVIVVRGDTGAAEPVEESTRVHDYSSEAVWHAVVDGEQQGPMTPIQLMALYARGSLTLDSYAWCEGFDDWKTLNDIPELLEALAPEADGTDNAQPDSDAPAEQPAGFGDAADTSSLTASSQASDANDPGLDGDALFGDPADNNADKDLFANVSTTSKGSAPPAAAAAPMTGQRNENSVLFSLDNLQALAGGAGGSLREQKKVSSVPATYGRRRVGPDRHPRARQIIGQKILCASSGATHRRPFFGPCNRGNVCTGGPNSGTDCRRHRKQRPWTLDRCSRSARAHRDCWHLHGHQIESRTQDSNRQSHCAKPNGNRWACGKGPRGGSTRSEKAPSRTRKNRRCADPRNGTTKRTPKRTTTKRSSTTRKSTTSTAYKPAKKSSNIDELMNEVLGGGGKSTTASKTKPPTTTSSGSGLPNAPSRSEVGRALGGVGGSVKACKQGDSGTATVAVTFSGDTGRVKSARIASGPFKGTAVGTCITNAVKRARVSRFKQSTFKVNYPYRL